MSAEKILGGLAESVLDGVSGAVLVLARSLYPKLPFFYYHAKPKPDYVGTTQRMRGDIVHGKRETEMHTSREEA